MDGSNNDRSKEVKPIQGFGIEYIRMVNRDSCSWPQHSWGKALIMTMMMSNHSQESHTEPKIQILYMSLSRNLHFLFNAQ